MQNGHADVVLLDLMMPELDGFGFLEALQKQPKLLRPAVILMTGAPDVYGRMKSSSLGAIDFVEKPVQSEDLTRRLERTLAILELERALAREEGALQAMRQVDRSTGIGTYTQLRDVLDKQFRIAEADGTALVCLLLLDLGHARALASGSRRGGDARLREMTQAVHAVLSTSYVFRVDAAELVVLLPAVTAEEARARTEALRARLVAETKFCDEDLAVGIAGYPCFDITQAGMLYRAANVALARARLQDSARTVVYL